MSSTNKFVSGGPIQVASGNPKGILLQLAEPQPVCRLVYISAGDRCGRWVYPAENTWQEWKDEDYKFPDKTTVLERKKGWVPPYHVGELLPVQEPWAFRKCGECYACESPQLRYQGKLGCFEYPNAKNLEYTVFQPAHLMPKEAARKFIYITRMQMMRLQKVPADQYSRDGFICPDGQPFPSDIRSIWDKSLVAADLGRYGWDADPFVWVATFERKARN